MIAPRSFLVLASLVALSTLAQAQVQPTATHSYVVEQMPRDGVVSIDLTTPTTLAPATVRYLDGLGRPAQQVQVRAGADGTTDLVSEVTTYDDYGRPKLTYLPAPGGTGGSWQVSPLTNGGNFYGDSHPFAETEYEASPLNRPTKQWGPGRAWRTTPAHPTTLAYGVATANTVVRFSVSATAIFGATTEGGTDWAYFGAQDIATRTTTDEQNNVTIEYTDLQGRLVRRDVQTGGSTLTTAYVYDGFERLGAVIPPKLYDWLLSGPTRTLSFLVGNVANPPFKDNAFAYQYDPRGRPIRKHIPGAGWTELVYDRQDRPVMSQDEQDQAEGYWQYTRYDGLSRPVQTGRLPLSRAAEALRTDFAGVSNEAFPATVNAAEAALLTERQYDNYNGLLLSYNAGGAFEAPFGNATGLLTRSRVRNLATGAWYESAMWYDDKGRPVQQQGQTVRGGTDRTDTQYRFNGEMLAVRIQREGITELTTYGYDHRGRKTAADHQLNGGSVQRLGTYSYDGIGRLSQKSLGGSGGSSIISSQSGAWNAPGTWQGGTVPGAGAVVTISSGQRVTLPGGSPQQAAQVRLSGQLVALGNSQLRLSGGGSALQVVAYSWHIRGGLLGLNLDGNGDPSLGGGQLFALKLGYEADGIYYNGNIRSQSWRTAGEGQLLSYSYDYDRASRLTSALGTGSGVVSVDNLGYDANGNLLSLNRAGIDALSYRYAPNSNRLLAVSDGTNNAAGFADGNTAGDDYAYDAAGSLTKDGNKGIASIAYNHLKLPRQISFSNGKTLDYQYDALGTKLKKTVSGGGTTTTTEYVGHQLWENGGLLQLAHEEGRYTPTGGYEWSLADHLGNLRVSFVNSNGVAQLVQAQHYDPWGWELPGLGVAGSNRYKYNDKEEQPETGLYDYGARLYDPLIGRWGVVDPLAELAHRWSPYGYGYANPLRFIDADGRAAQDFTYSDGYGAYSSRTTTGAVGFEGAYQDGPGPKGKTAEPPGYPSDVRSSAAQNAVLRPKDLGPQYTEVEKASQTGVNIAAVVEAPFSIARLGSWFKSLFTLAKDIKAVESVAGTVGQVARILPELTIDGIKENIIGGTFNYSNGYAVEFLAEQAVTSSRLELTNMVFYPKGIPNNELKNAFGPRSMLESLEALKAYAKGQGFTQLRVQFERAANSSSRNPGLVSDRTFNLK